jgi:hypothetical protein
VSFVILTMLPVLIDVLGRKVVFRQYYFSRVRLVLAAVLWLKKFHIKLTCIGVKIGFVQTPLTGNVSA